MTRTFPLTFERTLSRFRSDVWPHVLDLYGEHDREAFRNAWKNFVDHLLWLGHIGDLQRRTFPIPAPFKVTATDRKRAAAVRAEAAA